MAKYIVTNDFEVQWFMPPLTTPQVVKFPKGTTFDAVYDPELKKIVTTLDFKAPMLPLPLGAKILTVDESKIQLAGNQNKKTSNNALKWIGIAAAAALVIYIINKKK